MIVGDDTTRTIDFYDYSHGVVFRFPVFPHVIGDWSRSVLAALVLVGLRDDTNDRLHYHHPCQQNWSLLLLLLRYYYYYQLE
jgi:hypothetical protein